MYYTILRTNCSTTSKDLPERQCVLSSLFIIKIKHYKSYLICLINYKIIIFTFYWKYTLHPIRFLLLSWIFSKNNTINKYTTYFTFHFNIYSIYIHVNVTIKTLHNTFQKITAILKQLLKIEIRNEFQHSYNFTNQKTNYQ